MANRPAHETRIGNHRLDSVGRLHQRYQKAGIVEVLTVLRSRGVPESLVRPQGADDVHGPLTDGDSPLSESLIRAWEALHGAGEHQEIISAESRLGKDGRIRGCLRWLSEYARMLRLLGVTVDPSTVPVAWLEFPILMSEAVFADRALGRLKARGEAFGSHDQVSLFAAIDRDIRNGMCPELTEVWIVAYPPRVDESDDPRLFEPLSDEEYESLPVYEGKK